MIDLFTFLPQNVREMLSVRHGQSYFPHIKRGYNTSSGKLINWTRGEGIFYLDNHDTLDMLRFWNLHGCAISSGCVFRLEEPIDELTTYMTDLMKQQKNHNLVYHREKLTQPEYANLTEIFSIDHEINIYKIYQHIDFTKATMPEGWVKIENKELEKTKTMQAIRDGKNQEEYFLELYTNGTDYLYYLNYIDIKHRTEDFIILTLIAEIDPFLSSTLTDIEKEYYATIKDVVQFKNPTAIKRMIPINYKVSNQEYFTIIFRELIKKDLIKNFKNSLQTSNQRRLSEASRNIQDLEQRILTLYKTKHDIEKQIMFLEHKIDEDGLDYLFKHPSVRSVIRHPRNGTLEITIETEMNYINIEEVELFCKRGKQEYPFLVPLLKSLYVDGDGYLYSNTTFVIDFQNKTATIVQDDSFNLGMKSGINPHHYFFQCLGNYAPAISAAIRNLDFAVMIDLLVSTTKNLNVADSTVMNRYNTYLGRNNSNTKVWMHYKDEDMTYSDYLKYEKEETTSTATSSPEPTEAPRRVIDDTVTRAF